MRRATGAAVAGVMAVVCAVALSGCREHSLASRPANGVVTSTDTTAVPPAGNANGSTASADTGAENFGLDAVDSQLAGLDSALAKATQSPSDGG